MITILNEVFDLGEGTTPFPESISESLHFGTHLNHTISGIEVPVPDGGKQILKTRLTDPMILKPKNLSFRNGGPNLSKAGSVIRKGASRGELEGCLGNPRSN